MWSSLVITAEILIYFSPTRKGMPDRIPLELGLLCGPSFIGSGIGVECYLWSSLGPETLNMGTCEKSTAFGNGVIMALMFVV